MSYRFNASKCYAVVAAYPDLVVAPQLIAWLHANGVERIEAHRAGGGRMWQGYNYGARLALKSGCSQFVFADADVIPGVATAPFLAARSDVVGAQYDTGHAGAFDLPTSVHTGLWRCRRRVLEAVGARPFAWLENETGTGVVDCLCRPFLRRVADAGLSIEHAGEAFHEPKPRRTLPISIVLARPASSPEQKASRS